MNKPAPARSFRRDHLQYWYGDIARVRIIAEILSDSREKIALFAYGIGNSGDWARMMRDNEERIAFSAYEPDPEAYKALVKKFNGIKADIYTGSMTKGLQVEADYIVSFNVLGQAQNPEGYLRSAAKALAPDGVFYLLIDDRDCRPVLDLDEFRGIKHSLAGFMARHAGGFHRATGLGPAPVNRIFTDELQEMITAAGLQIVESRYEKLQAFESIAKTLPRDSQEGFTLFWLAVEDQLNARFRVEAGEQHGDTVNLGRAMTCRTFKLKHAADSAKLKKQA